MAVMLKEGGQHMQWYQDELLHMAKDIGVRLLPAFNTSSGLPYPRVSQTQTLNTQTLIQLVKARNKCKHTAHHIKWDVLSIILYMQGFCVIYVHV